MVLCQGLIGEADSLVKPEAQQPHKSTDQVFLKTVKKRQQRRKRRGTEEVGDRSQYLWREGGVQLMPHSHQYLF